MRDLSIIILAAGKGTRMKSSLPKVLNKIIGREMINMVVDSAKSLNPKSMFVVISEDMQDVQECILKNHEKVNFVIQKARNGTGHAVKVAVKEMQKKEKLGENVLILYGDVPLIKKETLENMY